MGRCYADAASGTHFIVPPVSVPANGSTMSSQSDSAAVELLNLAQVLYVRLIVQVSWYSWCLVA